MLRPDEVAWMALAAVLSMPQSSPAQIVAPAGRTLFNRSVMLRSFVRVDHFIDTGPGEETRRLVNPYAVVWGVYPNVSVTLVTPVVSLRRQTPGGSERPSPLTSFGDSSLLARVDVWRRLVPGGYTRLSPEVGVKMPTGGTFGSGSTDAIAGLVLSHVRDPHWLVGDVQFTYTTTGDGDLRAGNRWRYDFAYLHRLLPRDGLGIPTVLAVLEVNGEHGRHARAGDVPLPNSGGDLVFLSPGVELITSRRLVIECSVPIPIHRDLNGSQLEPAWSFIGGARWLF